MRVQRGDVEQCFPKVGRFFLAENHPKLCRSPNSLAVSGHHHPGTGSNKNVPSHSKMPFGKTVHPD